LYTCRLSDLKSPDTSSGDASRREWVRRPQWSLVSASLQDLANAQQESQSTPHQKHITLGMDSLLVGGDVRENAGAPLGQVDAPINTADGGNEFRCPVKSLAGRAKALKSDWRFLRLAVSRLQRFGISQAFLAQVSRCQPTNFPTFREMVAPGTVRNRQAARLVRAFCVSHTAPRCARHQAVKLRLHR